MEQYFAWSDHHLAIINGQTAQFFTIGPQQAAVVLAVREERIVNMWPITADARGCFTIRHRPGFRQVTALRLLFEAPGQGYMEEGVQYPVSASITHEVTLPLVTRAEVSRAARVGALPGLADGQLAGVAAQQLAGVAGGQPQRAIRVAPRIPARFDLTWAEWMHDDQRFGASCRLMALRCGAHYAKHVYAPGILPRFVIGCAGGAIKEVWMLRSVFMEKTRFISRGGWEHLEEVEVIYTRGSQGLQSAKMEIHSW